MTASKIPATVREFRAFEDHSGVSALVDVRVAGQLHTFSASYLGTAKVWLLGNASGTRRHREIAASVAEAAFVAEIARLTTPEYRERTRAFYASEAT